MKFVVLLLLGYLISSVVAFSQPGAYERLLYYYAYLIDIQVNGVQVKRKIAPGCAKLGKICSFNQFIEYIQEEPDDVASFDVTSDARPPLDTTANKLVSMGITEEYNAAKVLGAATAPFGGGVIQLIQQLSQFANGQVRKGKLTATDELITKFKSALGAINVLRTAASNDAVATALQTKYPGTTIKTTTAKLFDGSDNTAQVLDDSATVKANSKLFTKAQFEAIKKGAMNNGHTDINEAAEEAIVLFSSQCQK